MEKQVKRKNVNKKETTDENANTNENDKNLAKPRRIPYLNDKALSVTDFLSSENSRALGRVM